MAAVAVVVITFIIVGDINRLAPIVTMPFLLTYACIDYAYFALAQTFDIQSRREERFRIQAQSPSYETRRYGSTAEESNDLDQLFPERVHHKTVTTPSTPTRSQNGNHMPRSATGNSSLNSEVVFRDGFNSTNAGDEGSSEGTPIAPGTRPHIHSKTKNWYSGFCNRWASLIGAVTKILVMFLVHWVYALVCLGTVFVIWFYVGTANPAVKPGMANEFQFFVWLKGVIFRCFG